MKTHGRYLHSLVAVLISLGVSLFWIAGAAAGGGGTVTIHKAECPTGVGGAIFEECHDNGLGGVTFFIGPDGAEAAYVTDNNGIVGPVVYDAGHLNVVEDPAAVAEYIGVYVYCRDLASDTVIFDSDLDGYDGLHGEFPAGAEVVCDWYDITPASADTGGTTTTTTLPSTGDGSSRTELPALPFYILMAGAVVLAGFGLKRRQA